MLSGLMSLPVEHEMRANTPNEFHCNCIKSRAHLVIHLAFACFYSFTSLSCLDVTNDSQIAFSGYFRGEFGFS